MKSQVRYPQPPKTGAEADKLAAVLQKRFGYVTIGIQPGSETRLEVGQYVMELWGIATVEDYQVSAIGKLEDWKTQVKFLEQYFNKSENLIGKIKAEASPQFARVIRVTD